MKSPREISEPIEVPVRELRSHLAKWLKEAGDGQPIYITSDGRRSPSALVPAAFLDELRVVALPYPRSVDEAARLVMWYLDQGQEYESEELMERLRRQSTPEMAAVFTVFVSFFFTLWTKDSESGMIQDPTGTSQVQVSMCELLIPRLIEAGVEGHGISIIAGALWALQTGGDILSWRNSLALPLSYEEFYGWVMVACDLARLTNHITGDDSSAETLMYAADDFLTSDGSDGRGEDEE